MNKRQARKIVKKERIMPHYLPTGFIGYSSNWDMLTDSEREAARVFYRRENQPPYKRP